MEVFSTVISFLSGLLSDFMDVASRYWWVSAVLVLPLIWFLLSGLMRIFTSVRFADSGKYRRKYFGWLLKAHDDAKAQRRETERLRVAQQHFDQFKNAAYVDVDGKRYWRDGVERHKVKVGYRTLGRRTKTIVPDENE